MVTTRLSSWKKTPFDPNLNYFLHTQNRKVFRRPVASSEAVTVELPSKIKSTMLNNTPLPMKAFAVQISSEVEMPLVKQLPPVTQLSSKRSSWQEMIRYPTQLDEGLALNPEVTTRRVQYDFLLEGLFAEWRTRRQKFSASDPEDKAPGQSFFPHQHDQLKYWAWPFLGIIALTSSLPLVRSVKKPLSFTYQPFQIEIEAESNGLLTSQVFDTLSYTPNELTSKSNELFEQTFRLGLSPAEVSVPSNVALTKDLTTTVQHPVSNWGYSKMILDALIKKTYCHTVKSKPGYVSDVVFTTSESESYLPIEPVDDNDVHDFSGFLNFVKLKDIVYSRSFVLPFMTAKENWGHPVNPLLYRQWEKGLVYRYINQWLSTEADEMRRHRHSVQFASRHVQEGLRLEASFNELSLLKQFAAFRELPKVENKSETKTKPWTASMDSTQWLKSLILNAESVSTSLLGNKQQDHVKEVPTNVTLLAQDWPSLPNQFNRISKSSDTYPEIDNTSFLKPLTGPEQTLHTAIEVAKVIGLAELLQDTFLPLVPISGVQTLGDRLSNWLINWSFTYSAKDGIINDATFTNQCGEEPGRAYAQTVKWTRPQISQNPNYQALSTMDTVNRNELPEQLFRAYFKYQSGKKVLPTISSDLTHTLEKTQYPLHFDYDLTSGKTGSKSSNDDSPTPRAILKTLMFRSPSTVDDALQGKNLALRRRRANRYRRASFSKKKRKRIYPRPNWLQEGLSNSLFKRRHPSVKAGNNNSRLTNQRSGEVRFILNLQNKFTPKRANAKIPSLFRQKGLNHSLMSNLPQLMDRNRFHLAKWAKPKSTLKSWRQLMFGDEYTPYKNAASRNLRHLRQASFDHPLTTKLVQMPQWFWKGSRSEVDIEGLRFKQLPSVNNFGSFVEFNSDATTSRLLLNELRSVAVQNAAIYKRLNTMISLQRNKMGFMAEKRPNLSNVNRVRRGSLNTLIGPKAWFNVAFNPSNQTQSHWIVKQSHLLRDPYVTDIQLLWQTGKLRTLNKAVRESTQKGVFQLRLPFVNRFKVQPVTVQRSWQKVKVMDTKLKVFGLLSHRTDLYPRQLKCRLQKQKGALNAQNVLLTPRELEMQQSINDSVQFWWDETQHNLLPLVNPLGTQPWSMFDGAMSTPQLTSESQSLTINLVNSSLILLHVAFLSFLIQLPETRTFLKFYVLVLSRVVEGYVWMTTMCYSLLLDCIYEIKFACQWGYRLMFMFNRDRPYTTNMVYMYFHRVSAVNPSSDPFTWTRFNNAFADKVSSKVVKRFTSKDVSAVHWIENSLYRHDVLTGENHDKSQTSQDYREYQAAQIKRGKDRNQQLSPKHFAAHNAVHNGSEPPSHDPSGNGSGPPSHDPSERRTVSNRNGNGAGPYKFGSNGNGAGPYKPESNGNGNGTEPKHNLSQDRAGVVLQNVTQIETKQKAEEQKTLGPYRYNSSGWDDYKRPNFNEYPTEYLEYAESLLNECLDTDIGTESIKNLQTKAWKLENVADKSYELWWGYRVMNLEDRSEIFRSMFPSMSTDDDDELANHLVEVVQTRAVCDYELAYMKERQNVYKTRLALDPVSVGPLYEHTLQQGVLVREILADKLSRVFTKWGRMSVGLYLVISRKSYELYDNVDTAMLTARDVTLKFMEEPAENAMIAFNNYFFSYFMSDILSNRLDEVETWNTVMVEGYTRQLNAFGPLGSVLQRRLHRVFDDFYIAFTRPDMDLLLRHQKSLIFWDMWGVLLIRAIARYELSLVDFMETKEEQEKLLECLVTESDWSWTQQSLIQFQPLFDLLNVGDRNWKAFTMPSVAQYLGDPPPLETVLESHIEAIPPNELTNLNLEAFESFNPADVLYADNHAISFDDLSQQWGAQQSKVYPSRLSTLGVEYHPPCGLKSVPQVTQYFGIHTQLGGIIKDNLLTTFTQTPSKNALIVGPQGPEVTSLVRALVGELELKFICDSARRYTTVIKNVAIGVRHLKEVFYSISVEAPCLFVLEDIHLVGQRRELLIAEDEELYLLEKNQVMDQNDPEEQDYIVDKFEKHTLLLYEKPYRGDYSFLIATNCFAYDFFLEVPTSRLRHAGRFTQSHYNLHAIEHELVKLRGLENLSNIQSDSPGLTVTTRMEARKPIKEVKAAPNSPLTVAIEKNKKAFRPRRIVKNMPLQGISWDMWMLLSRYDYSIRSKVALLAVLTEDALGELTDTITDLLVMMDTVRATRGLVMFATTHSPTSLDPALRRPGRLDETLQIPLYSSMITRWQLLNQRLKGLDRLQELAPYAHLTRDLANYQVLEFALKTTMSLLPKKVSLYDNTKPPGVRPVDTLKRTMQISYFTAFFQSKGFNSLKEQLEGIIDVPSERQMLDTQLRERKFQSQVNTLTYSLVGAHLIRWKAKVITDEMEAEPLTYSMDKVNVMLTRYEIGKNKSDFALALMRDPVVLREHYTNSLAPRFAETFFTSTLVNAGCPLSLNNLYKEMGAFEFTFQLREKNNYVPLTFERFELAATRFKPGGSTAMSATLPAFRNNLINVGVPATRMSYFVSAIAQKRLVWSKNTIVHRLFYAPMKQAYSEALGLPVYDITDRDKQFETLQKEQRVLYTPGNLTMNEKIELHKTYRLYLAVANRTVEDWHNFYKPEELQLLKRHVLPSLEELSSLAFVMNHPTGTTKYYRQSMHLRQRFHLIDEWWNGHLEDFDVETALARDVETRTFFVEAIGNDVEIDYPQPDKYYNVRSRRWVSKEGNETWFLKEAKYNDTIAYHYMVCALTRCYGQLHTHRESLDQLAYSFLKEGSLSEVETFTHYTRFYHT